MRILGLTGDIACGKSTVARLLAEKGAATLDADLLVRELYADHAFAARVAQLFETDILDLQGGIDRERLGAVVFEDASKLQELEKLVHPAVAQLRSEKLRKLESAGQRAAVIEAVKLLESGQGNVCDEIWCVVCAPEEQISRLMNSRGLSHEQALLRLQNQPSRAAKTELAASTPLVWIENNGTLTELSAQIAREWTRFLA
jgi:dephospho-CoA kinase